MVDNTCVPPPSTSHHQDYFIFRLENPNRKLTAGTPKMGGWKKMCFLLPLGAFSGSSREFSGVYTSLHFPVLQGAPVFKCPVPSPTVRSAMKVSSVSPER